jgi:hypothetical protein
MQSKARALKVSLDELLGYAERLRPGLGVSSWVAPISGLRGYLAGA